MRSVTSTIMAAMATCLIADRVHAVDIPVSAREQVKRQCLPVQHREGADAYRECATNEIARIGETAPDPLNALDLDEQFLVQSTCSSSTGQDCIAEQLEALSIEPKPSLVALSSDERLVLSNTCLTGNEQAGALTYRRCVNEQLAQLASLPEPALGSLGLLERNALELSCGNDTANLSGYRQCLVEMAGAASDADSSAVPSAGTASDSDAGESLVRPFETQDNDSVNAAEVASADRLDLGTGEPTQPDDTAPLQNEVQNETPAADSTVPSTTGQDAETTGSFDLSRLISDARARLTGTLQGLDTVGQSVLAAALILPLLLVGLWALMRSRGSEEDEYDMEYEDVATRHDLEPDLALAEHRFDEARYDVDDAFDDFEPPPRVSTEAADASTDEALPATRIARPLSAAERGAQQPSLERELDLDLDDNVTRLAPKPERDLSEHKPRTAAFAWHSAFGEWLSKQLEHTRLQSVIELFIYWMAYGDDRYDEQMRQAVMSEPNPDSHDLIKRWVLESDAYALADAISWMQRFSSRAQRCQTLDLLMTLLVTDGAMTPVQNTLLRFFTDAFGLGEAELDLQYSRAFGEPMPALPRVDKPTWWAQQDQVRMERWDARGLLLRPDEEQFRIRLGLSLTGNLDDQDINDAYRRAARRCQPERFDALGQRELALVKRQLSKLNEAREGLLGVNA